MAPVVRATEFSADRKETLDKFLATEDATKEQLYLDAALKNFDYARGSAGKTWPSCEVKKDDKVDIRCHSGIEAESGMTPEAESGMTPEAESGMTPEAESGMTPEAESGMTPEAESGMTPEQRHSYFFDKDPLRYEPDYRPCPHDATKEEIAGLMSQFHPKRYGKFMDDLLADRIDLYFTEKYGEDVTARQIKRWNRRLFQSRT